MIERYQPAHQLFTRNATICKTLQSIASCFFTSQLIIRNGLPTRRSYVGLLCYTGQVLHSRRGGPRAYPRECSNDFYEKVSAESHRTYGIYTDSSPTGRCP